jgi:type IV pilus assembly protein PilC
MNEFTKAIVSAIKFAANVLKPRQEAVLGKKIFYAFKARKITPRMNLQEKIIFIKRLAILIESGIPIILCLEMLSRQSNSSGAKKIIDGLRGAMEEGKSLAQGMDLFAKTFGNFSISIVAVGETGGALAKNLDYLAEELRKRKELKRNISGALVYPVFILFATLGITVLLAGYVFPKILPVFSSFGGDLPASTRALIGITYAAQNYWPPALAAVVFLTALTPFLLKTRRVRYFFDRNLLRLPLLGAMFKSYYIANFSRNLGLLLAGQVGIVRALEISGCNAGNLAYQYALERITGKVKRGGSLAGAMEKEKNIFPALPCQMVGAGENSGNLSSSLIYLSRIYEDEMDNSTKNLSASVEPALMVFMGILVGFVAVSIIQPIYGITTFLQQ